MDAIAIWLAHPQRMTFDSLDAFLDETLGKPDQQRLCTELIATVAYLTRSAQRLWQERCLKVSGPITGLTSSSPILATAYTPPPTVYTMIDYFSLVFTSQRAKKPSTAASISTISSTPPYKRPRASPKTPLAAQPLHLLVPAPPATPLFPSDSFLMTLVDSVPTLSAASAHPQEIPRRPLAEPDSPSPFPVLYPPPPPISPFPLYPPRRTPPRSGRLRP
jgi:hypothetical protein